MKLAIVMSTFYKKDGSTLNHLLRALNSIKNQIHKDYFVYLIGDDYLKNDELMSASKTIDADKIKVVNLPIALERSKYTGRELWVCGGCNAYNFAIDLAKKDNLNYICHLDHDDYWSENHLSEVNNVIEKFNTNFVCTLSKTKIKTLPEVIEKEKYINFIPEANKLTHSSSCVNFSYFKMNYRNMVEEFKKTYPSDADLWNRIGSYLKDKGETGILINEITTFKDSGMSVLNNKNII